MSSNDVGTFAAMIALLSLARLFPASYQRFNKSWYGLLLLCSVITMILAQTRSAFAGIAFGGFFIVLFSKRGKLGAVFTFIVAPILAVSTMGGLILSFLERGETRQQLATLSSRADWWSFAWQTFLERPLLGFGAYAAGRFAVLAKIGQGSTSSLHSDYLDVLVGTSIWGMIPFIVTLVATWWLLLRYVRDTSVDPEDRQLIYEGLAIFALLTFRSFFSDVMTWHPPLAFFAILCCVEQLRRKRCAAIQLDSRRLSRSVVEEFDPQLELVFDARNSEISHSATPSC
jgi:O-antigen ligase